jgi:hypothetical protein
VRQRLVVIGDRCSIERNAERGCDLDRRQLPQATEQTIGATAREEELVSLGDPDERAREDRQLAVLLARGDDRQLGLAAVASRDAVRGDRADETARIGRRAESGAELHEPLVEIPWYCRRGQRRHQRARVRP